MLGAEPHALNSTVVFHSGLETGPSERLDQTPTDLDFRTGKLPCYYMHVFHGPTPDICTSVTATMAICSREEDGDALGSVTLRRP